MTHFLGRLVERARGTVPRVEPIIAPRFAPVPVAEVASEIEAPLPIPREVRETEVPDRRNRAVVRREENLVKGPEKELVERLVQAAPETLLVPLPQANDDVAERPGWTRGSGSLRRDVLPHVQSAAAKAFVRRGNHHPRSAIPQRSDRPAVSANSLTLPNESRTEPPIVRVTIGRIEVHAAPAPAPPRKAPSPSGPKLTLDAYLKERKKGAR